METGTGYFQGQNRVSAAPPDPVGDSQVVRSLKNLEAEINGLAVTSEVMCARIGIASRPYPMPPDGQEAKAIEPITSLLVKKIDDQAKRVRNITNQLQAHIEGLDL